MVLQTFTSNPTPPGFVYTDPGPGVPDEPPMPPLTEVFDARPIADGGYVIPGLTPRLGADTLHHGPILVAMEAAAVDVAALEAGDEAISPVALSCRIVRAGRHGPFGITSRLLGRNGNLISCRSLLPDEGRGDDIVAIMLWQARMGEGKRS